MHKKTQQGFTLIELVMVIVILGILAATALPRFVNLGGDARAAAINGLAGGVRSAVVIVQARHAASGGAGAEVFLQGQTGTGNGVAVTATTGLPVATAIGIGRALQDTSGFTVAYSGNTATYQQNGLATCQAVYDDTTGLVTVTASTC